LLGDGACFDIVSDVKYGGGGFINSRMDTDGVNPPCGLRGSVDERKWVVVRCFRASDDRTIAICDGTEEFSIITRARVGCRFLLCLVGLSWLGFFAFDLPLRAEGTAWGSTSLDINLW
jgi:hypothetical protein